jgi:hypothetical protein
MERKCGMETSPKTKATTSNQIKKRALRIICPGKDYNEALKGIGNKIFYCFI